MSDLAQLQSEFASAVHLAERRVPSFVTSYTSPQPLKRFNVYRNNVYTSLMDVLEARFPIVLRLVGEDFFRAASRVFVEQHLPKSPLLMEYGDVFGDFLDSFEPVADEPYLGDIARIEFSRMVAYHATDAEPLGADDFASVNAGDVPSLQFSLHPSLQIVSSPFPIVSIWETNSNDDDVKPIDIDGGGEDAMIIRPELEVQVRRLPEGACAFIGAIKNGAALDDAFQTASKAFAEFDLQENLTGLIVSGALLAYQLDR